MGVLDCELFWTAKGTPVDPIPSTCQDCDFVFDVTMTYDTTSTASADCSTLATDFTYTYGNPYNLYGYGYHWAALGYYGYYYVWAYSSWDGATFTYWTGYYDYYYSDSYGYYADYKGYNTNYWYGFGAIK